MKMKTPSCVSHLCYPHTTAKNTFYMHVHVSYRVDYMNVKTLERV